MHANRLFTTLVFSVAIESACIPKPTTVTGRPRDPIPVQYEDEAARSGLAVLSVASWDDYVASLQPIFAITAADALQQAIPVAARQQAEVLDAFNLAVRLAPPTSARTSSNTQSNGTSASNQNSNQNTQTTQGTQTQPATGEPTSTQTTTQSTTSTLTGSAGDTASTQSSSTTTRQAGDLTKVNAPTIPGLPTALVPSTSPLSGDIQIDPLTRYSAATALFQEVQLLNRYVQDAALRPGSKAFVVRLQVSLLPQLRDQAYDAYSMLSFFSAPATSVLSPYAARPKTAGTAEKVAIPTVVPLLVTDSIEQSVGSSSASTVRSLGLALTALVGGFGASADVGRQAERLEAAIAEDTNSLLTVSKVSTNVLRVRFGAVRQLTNGLAMQPRNHTVTVLLLVPDSAPNTVNVSSKLELVRASDGKPVPSRPYPITQAEVRTTVCRYVTSCTALDANGSLQADNLAYAVQREDNTAFDTALQTLDVDLSAKQRLWTDLLDVLSKNPFTATSFYLPPVAATKKPTIPDQLVTAIDDGNKTTADVRGFVGDFDGRVVAELVVTKGGNDTALMSTGVAFDGNILRLAFPSLQKLKFCDGTTCTLRLQMFWTEPKDKWKNAAPAHSQVVELKNTVWLPVAGQKPTTVFFTIVSGAHQIATNAKGEGTLRLVVQPDSDHIDEKMFFVIDGGDIVEATGAGGKVVLASDGWQVTPDKTGAPVSVKVSLANLVADVDVKVTPTNGKGSRDSLFLRVKPGK